MTNIQEAGTAVDPLSAPAITVSVNERPVVFHQHRVTGAEIKATAIAQKVPIQQDFALFEVKGPGQLRQIGDDEVVELHQHEKFRAVAPDDNSGGTHDA
jgi:hypothetical protein